MVKSKTFYGNEEERTKAPIQPQEEKNTRYASHAYTKWDCTYHIVSITKYRRKVLYGEVRKKPMLIIKQLCHYKGIEVAEGTMCVNHVHSSLRIPPKQSVAEVMGYLKGEERTATVRREPESETPA